MRRSGMLFKRRLGQLAGVTVTAMFIAHMTGCEVDTEQGGLTFQLPEGGRFDLPGSDGSSADVTTQADVLRSDAKGDTGASPPSPDGSSDAAGHDAAIDAVTADASADAVTTDAVTADAIADVVVVDAAVVDVFVFDADIAN